MKIIFKALPLLVLNTCRNKAKYLIKSYPFADKTALQNAVNQWVSNRSQAEADYGPIHSWDVSLVTDMSQLFQGKVNFNDDISSWKTSRVTNMSSMFGSAQAFNGDLSAWDTSKVTNMGAMFYDARAFNRDLSCWDTSNVTSMSSVFYYAFEFNQDLSAWDISKVTQMTYMFYYARNFNQTLCWDISHVTANDAMFPGTNGKIGDCARPTSNPSCANTKRPSQPSSKPSVKPSERPSAKPSSKPSYKPVVAKCVESKRGKFLKAVLMENYDFIPVLRSCKWLQRQKPGIRNRICNRKSFSCYPTAKDLCQVTCQSCKME